MKRRRNSNVFNVLLMNVIIGSVIAVSSAILLILMVFAFIFLNESSLVSSVSRNYSLYLIAGISISIVLMVISIIFLFRNAKKISEAGERSIQSEVPIRSGLNADFIDTEKVMQFLDEGEKEVYGLLADAGGSILQKNIMSAKGYSRASITRILDRLESKGLIERIRHGSTNEIILKRISK